MSTFTDTAPVFELSLKTSGLNKVFLVAENIALRDSSTAGDKSCSGSLIVASAFFPFAHLESEKGLNEFLKGFSDEALMEELSRGVESLYEAYKVLRLSKGKASAEDHRKALTDFEIFYAENSGKLEKILSYWEVYEYRYEFK